MHARVHCTGDVSVCMKVYEEEEDVEEEAPKGNPLSGLFNMFGKK